MTVEGNRQDTAAESDWPSSIGPIAVTVKGAAKLLSTNEKQIRRAIYAREIPTVRLGKSYIIGLVDLISWFDRKKAFL